MGCDIHAHIEISRDNGKTWELAVEDVIEARDYKVFAIMAGVRGMAPRLGNGLDRIKMKLKNRTWPRHFGSSRGLPENMSEQLQAIYVENSDHSPSWGDVNDVKFWEYLNLRDEQDELDYVMKEDPKNYRDYDCFPVRSCLTPVIESMSKQMSVGKGRQVRLIFWFDS